VGNYRLLSRVGEGGMGEVYEALQERPVRRRVAVKLIKPGMHSREVAARFLAERQALSLMDHPNIAKVFDAGVADDGRPFFVMELVPGVPITDYCDRNRLSVEERLELFLPVCAGVQHAHHKAIIHRDLKPTNILVSVRDGRPVPRIIDFGVAKATSQPLTEETLYTSLGQIIGTPAYMSPEQAGLSPDIDVRADIYSLGAVLYEILTGRRPLELDEAERGGVEATLRAIREREAPRPSARVEETPPERAAAIARARRLDGPRLTGRLRGDLDWIISKALEKSPARRYDSASDLAADLRRHLADEPVEAGPPGTAYRLGKFARRHRVAISVAAALVFAAVGTAAALTYALVQSNRQRAEVQAAHEESEAVTRFLAKMLAAVHPEASGRDVTVRQILDEASRSIDAEFAERPLIRARLRETIGSSYRGLGDFPEAEVHLTGALETQARLLGEGAPAVAATSGALGLLYQDLGRFGESESLLTRALGVSRRELGPEHPASLQMAGTLGRTLQLEGRLDEAESLFVATVDALRRTAGPDGDLTLSTSNNLAALYLNQGRWDDAEPLFTDLLRRHRSLRGPEHPTTLTVTSNLALLYRSTGRSAEAEPLYVETLAAQRRLLGDRHPSTLASMNNLSLVYLELERYRDAEPLAREALEIQRAQVGDDHPHSIIALGNLGDLLSRAGRPGEGEPLLARAVERARLVLPPGHAIIGETLRKHGVCLGALGRPAEAQRALEDAYASLESGLGAGHPRTLHAARDLAELCDARGRPAEGAAWRAKAAAD
jgi:non-specific serine/threonine protein kinase/serine/threonine-protein kinase